jgi:hypothetical protein
VLEVYVNDSHLTGRPKVGRATLPLSSVPRDGKLTVALPLEPVNAGQKPQGEVLLDVSFKVFEDDEQVGGAGADTHRLQSHRPLIRVFLFFSLAAGFRTAFASFNCAAVLFTNICLPSVAHLLMPNCSLTRA